MPPSPPRDYRDPVRLLLLAYEGADVQAALHYQALHTTGYPRCLALAAAHRAFRRHLLTQLS